MDGAGEEATMASEAGAGSSAVEATPSPKPTKKSTMDELKTALEEFGLDTKGKKDTLFKCVFRLICRLHQRTSLCASV